MANNILTTVGWTTQEVWKLTGATPRKIRYWVAQGLLEVSPSPAPGRGKKLRFNLKNILVIFIIMELTAKGLSIHRIRQTVTRARERWGLHQPLAELRIACLAQNLVYKKNGVYIEGLSGQQVFDIAVDKIRQRLGDTKSQRGKGMALKAVEDSVKVLEVA